MSAAERQNHTVAVHCCEVDEAAATAGATNPAMAYARCSRKQLEHTRRLKFCK
jgi:hypothetical protein